MQLSGFFALLVGTFILSSSGLTSAKSNVMDKYTDESTIVRRLRGEDSVEEEKGFTSIYESAKRWFTKPLVEATVKTNKEGKEVLVIPPKQAAILAKNGIDSKELAANPTMEHLASVLNTYVKGNKKSTARKLLTWVLALGGAGAVGYLILTYLHRYRKPVSSDAPVGTAS